MPLSIRYFCLLAIALLVSTCSQSPINPAAPTSATNQIGSERLVKNKRPLGSPLTSPTWRAHRAAEQSMERWVR